MKKSGLTLFVVIAVLFCSGLILGQVATPNANINVIGLIPIPGWTTAAGSFDLATFNPVNRLMYFADGTNHTVTTLDTVSNTFVSSIQPVPCVTSNCPSGIQIAPDLQKLVLTSRQTTDWIYDLKTPGAPPVTLTMPAGSDELDYDPIHQRAYIANTTAPFYLIAIDLTGPNANTITAQLPLPGNPEQPRFNPVDGMVYMA